MAQDPGADSESGSGLEDERFLPPFVTAEEVDFEADLETLSMAASVISTVVVVLTYAGYLEKGGD